MALIKSIAVSLVAFAAAITSAAQEPSQPLVTAPQPEVSNKVFLVSVDTDTTDKMMDKVIDKYGLEVIYDYSNFNMYAIAVPEPLDAEQTETFITELESSYSFILMVEPDSIMYLDNAQV